MSFEEFEASLGRDPDTGAYIVDRDIRVWSRAELRKYVEAQKGQSVARNPRDATELRQGALTIKAEYGLYDKWSPAQQNNLTYCVSTEFGENWGQAVVSMFHAAQAWQAAANVTFIWDSSQDGNCTNSNSTVVFNVRPLYGWWEAHAFFPSYPREQRDIGLHVNLFNDLDHLDRIVRHELGHVLGFRHEHSAGVTPCYETHTWSAVTPYDVDSIMRYPSCEPNGNSVDLSYKDRNGAACVYGAAPGFTPNCTYPGVRFFSYVPDLYWLHPVMAGNITGTVGQNRRLDALVAFMDGTPGVGICYQPFLSGLGWRPEVCDGGIAGMEGQDPWPDPFEVVPTVHYLQALRIRLVNAPAGCKVYYRVNVARPFEQGSWQWPVSDFAVAGTPNDPYNYISAVSIWTGGSCTF